MNVALPCVMLRSVVAYPNISESGTSLSMAWMPFFISMPRTLPRRELRLLMTSPTYSSGTSISTFMMGSSRMGFAFSAAFLNAMEPATRNAISELSTSCVEPSTSLTLKSTTS